MKLSRVINKKLLSLYGILICSQVSLILMLSSKSFAQENSLPAIEVQDLYTKMEQAGRLKPVIERTQIVTQEKIKKHNLQSLAQVVDNEPGVTMGTACSICGIREVRMNGLRGEYTTILLDDMPVNSTVMSYYGFDALTTSGISRIEMARGSGASLLAPEAIGGVINIITKKATRSGSEFNMSYGELGSQNLGIVSTSVSEDGKWRLTTAAQSMSENQADIDGNLINETPRRKSSSAFMRLVYEISDDSQLDFKLGFVKANVFGGYLTESELGAITQSNSVLGMKFQNDDIRKKYIGQPSDLIEAINTDRIDTSLKWTQQLNENDNLITSLAYAQSKQDSIYEANDYRNLDDSYYLDIKYNTSLSSDWLLTAGFDFKNELMLSQSKSFFESLGLPKDEFVYKAQGAYLQGAWDLNEQLSLTLAARFNQVTVDYTHFAGIEIEKNIIVPRFFAKYNHSQTWTSRFGLGQGFRAPLTFFESEHGLLDQGFKVQPTELEQSDSALYTLSYDNNKFSFSSTASWTEIKNASYVETSGLLPTLKNANQLAQSTSFDFLIGYQFDSPWSISFGYESYQYSDFMKSLFWIAPIETRALFGVGYSQKTWDIQMDLSFVGARDLAVYGYGNRFNAYDYNLNQGIDAKSLEAPHYGTINLSGDLHLDKQIKLTYGVKNLLDYTQVTSESPLFYDELGHIDVGHVWGPLRGRVAYLGLSGQF